MASPNNENGAQPADQSGLPEWARIQADLPTASDNFDIDETPAAPAAPAVPPAAPVAAPSGPARPRRAAPQAPAQPVPVPAQPVPVQPAVAQPVPVPAPVVEPAPAPAKPRSKPAPVIEPEEDFTMEVVKPRPKPKTLPAPVANQTFVPQPTAAPAAWEQAAESTGKPAKSDKSKNMRRKATSANAGGRWKVLAVRYSIYGAIGLVLLLGVIRLVNPNPVNIQNITDSVLTQIGRNGFPLETGQQMGARFTREYLSYDATKKDLREQALNAYLPGGVKADFTYSLSGDPSWRQSVIDGPYVVGLPDVIDATHIAITYASLVANPLTGTKDGKGDLIPAEWIYLTVPMSADENGHVAVSGPPAFVPAPVVAKDITYLNVDIDADASAQALPRVKEFLEQWAAASVTVPVSEQYLTKSATDEARNGLSGLVTLQGSPTIEVETSLDEKATERNANATVTWTTKSGMKLTQTYRMILVNDGQYWYVQDIHGASFQTVR